MAGTDKDSVKVIIAEVIKKHGKGWTYAGIVPLAALVAGETQPQGFCYLFKGRRLKQAPRKRVRESDRLEKAPLPFRDIIPTEA